MSVNAERCPDVSPRPHRMTSASRHCLIFVYPDANAAIALRRSGDRAFADAATPWPHMRWARVGTSTKTHCAGRLDVLHTLLVGNLRLVLDVQVSLGKQHTSGRAKTALGRLLDERRPMACKSA